MPGDRVVVNWAERQIMGVVKYLLDRRTVTVRIGDSRQAIGTLRRFFKITELDEERNAELEAADGIRPSPVAAMIMDESEFALASDPTTPVRSHLVLGWDEGMGSVTDFGWDFLPELGYAVRDPASGEYTLFELRNDRLLRADIEATRADSTQPHGVYGRCTTRQEVISHRRSPSTKSL